MFLANINRAAAVAVITVSKIPKGLAFKAAFHNLVTMVAILILPFNIPVVVEAILVTIS